MTIAYKSLCEAEIRDYRDACRRVRSMLAAQPALALVEGSRLVRRGKIVTGPATPRPYTIRRSDGRYAAEVHYRGLRYSCGVHRAKAGAEAAAAAKVAELAGG